MATWISWLGKAFNICYQRSCRAKDLKCKNYNQGDLSVKRQQWKKTAMEKRHAEKVHSTQEDRIENIRKKVTVNIKTTLVKTAN